MTKIYFIFGEEAVRVLNEESKEQLIQECFKGNISYELFEWNEHSLPQELLHAYQGNEEFAVIDEKTFKYIQRGNERVAYHEAVKELKTELNDSFKSFIINIAESLMAATDVVKYNLYSDSESDGEYVWWVDCFIAGNELPSPDATIEVKIMESLVHEESFDGINFSLKITNKDGDMLVIWELYNYTPDVWVDVHDKEAVKKRLEEFFSFSVDSLLSSTNFLRDFLL